MTVPALPATIAPPPPFPLVVAQSRTTEAVAPGIRRATYRLMTSQGPLVVNVVAIDPREPTVRFESVVARDRMISSGETISSMAQRTNAVAGINADYFDIGNTNQPLGAVVKGGALLRTPSKRIVMDVRTDRSVRFENVTFGGSLAYGGATVPLTSVNEWPPQGGASFLTPAYGTLKAAPGVMLAELVAADPVHLPAEIAGTYRVASIAQSAAQTVQGPMLAFGPAALAVAPPPSVGDSVTIAATTAPPLESLAAAVGGGPLLVAGGEPADDPNAPAPEETDVRFPVAGAGRMADGDIVLVTVDGREAALSIGVTRPEFAALFLGFGATDAMAFDSGGSATLVARVLGDGAASVLNAPSDGEERAVGDGLFVYSDAPLGPPAQLVVRPAPIVALPHAAVPVRLLLVDAAGHALGLTHLAGGDVLIAGTASEERTVRAGGIVADVAIDVVPRIARLAIAPDIRNPDPGATIVFTASAFDARGRPVELGDALRWSADRGAFSKPGTYRAVRRDARIVARAPGAQAEFDLPVGRHDEALPFIERSLAYDFSGGERAAYADADILLPGVPQTFGVEIFGDRSGVGVRAAFVNRFGERRALTLAKSVDWSGWEARAIRLPDDLNPPVRLVALYAVDSLATATHAAGTLAFRNATVIVAGTP